MMLAAAGLLSGCDLLGIEKPEKVEAAREADGKAIGGACRQAMHGIEECFQLNPKGMRAAIFAGWREMDEYMRENKLEGMPPPNKGESAAKAEPEADAASQAKSAKGGKPPAKETGDAKQKSH
jgi:hypothetical protein